MNQNKLPVPSEEERASVEQQITTTEADCAALEQELRASEATLAGINSQISDADLESTLASLAEEQDALEKKLASLQQPGLKPVSPGRKDALKRKFNKYRVRSSVGVVCDVRACVMGHLLRTDCVGAAQAHRRGRGEPGGRRHGEEAESGVRLVRHRDGRGRGREADPASEHYLGRQSVERGGASRSPSVSVGSGGGLHDFNVGGKCPFHADVLECHTATSATSSDSNFDTWFESEWDDLDIGRATLWATTWLTQSSRRRHKLCSVVLTRARSS